MFFIFLPAPKISRGNAFNPNSFIPPNSRSASPSKIRSSLRNVSARFRFQSSIHNHLLLYTYHLTTLSPSPPQLFPQSISSILQHSCIDLLTLKKLHASLIVSTTGYESLRISSKLFSLYAQFNDIDSAVLMFNTFTEPNTVLWNTMIKSLADSGLLNSAFVLYKRMRELGIKHDSFTFPVVNRMVGLLKDSGIWCGVMIHCLAIKMGFEFDVYFCNTMIEAYVKGGYFGYACQVFDEMTNRDLVSWTSMISAYVGEGDVIGAFRLFHRMLMMEVEPNCITIMVMLLGCSANEGRQLHGYVVRKGFMRSRSLQNSFLKMYTSKCCTSDAEIFFGEIVERDVISWNIMISYICLTGDVRAMSDCFREMQLEVFPNIETITILISQFAEGACCSQGRQTHCLAIKSGFHDSILETALLVFYAKCGEMDASVRLFNEIPRKSNITWSAMVSGFIQNGCIDEAIELIKQILDACVKPKVEILKNLVEAYSHLGALKLGKGAHGYFLRNLVYESTKDTISLQTSILNMYIRCGSIYAARVCFDRMVDRDLVAWTSMIEGLGTHGLGNEALSLFHLMLDEGIEPNNITFLGLLSACSHSGLLNEGCELFTAMKWRFRIQPDLNHFTCVVDLLGRHGMLKEALSIILKLVPFPDSRIWGALLSACRVHEDRKLGEYMAHQLLELEPHNVGYCTLLSNLQASSERWDYVEEVRSSMKDKDLIKQPGWSCIEANGLIHGFVAGDRSNHQGDEIYEVLGCLSRKMQESGDGMYG